MYGPVFVIKPDEYLEMLKVLNSTNKFTLEEILDTKSWAYPDEFEDIWKSWKVNVFHGLCSLDNNNLSKVLEYASRKAKKNEQVW